MNLKDLGKPFPKSDIEWRIAQSGIKNGKPWGKVLAYITNRAIMERLDEVCGPEKWKNDFKPSPDGGVLCGISIKIGDEWVTKWDGAGNTQFEAVKGGLSGAMKRSGSQWNIGRYLYKLEAGWANFCDNGRHTDIVYPNKQDAKNKKNGVFCNWDPPVLPEWALPEGSGAGMGSKPKKPSSPPQKPEDELLKLRKEIGKKCKANKLTKGQASLFKIWYITNYQDETEQDELTIAGAKELNKSFTDLLNNYNEFEEQKKGVVK